MNQHRGLTTPYYSYKVWGQTKLAKRKGAPERNELDEPLGESWEVAKLSEGESLLHGKSMEFSPQFILKLIATSEELSIQVHPDDHYALKRHGECGKTEGWVILDHEPGAKLYLGLKPHVSLERLKEVLSSGGNVVELMNEFTVAKGDYYFVPAGTLHAIGANITLAEFQQASGKTYRVWDWNRPHNPLSPRPLHLADAFEVLAVGEAQCFQYFKNIHHEQERELLNHSDFRATSYRLKAGQAPLALSARSERAQAVIVLEGALEVSVAGGPAAQVQELQTWVMGPNQQTSVSVRAEKETWLLWID
jgi:mannose-6-phosphate isomerase